MTGPSTVTMGFNAGISQWPQMKIVVYIVHTLCNFHGQINMSKREMACNVFGVADVTSGCIGFHEDVVFLLYFFQFRALKVVKKFLFFRFFISIAARTTHRGESFLNL